MSSKVRQHNDTICVLRINAAVLDLSGVIIADRNASSDYARFYPVRQGLAAIDKDRIFARYWTHPGSPFEEMEHKSIKCSEVLVPERIQPQYVLGAYVANSAALTAFRKLKTKLTATINNDIFF